MRPIDRARTFVRTFSFLSLLVLPWTTGCAPSTTESVEVVTPDPVVPNEDSGVSPRRDAGIDVVLSADAGRTQDAGSGGVLPRVDGGTSFQDAGLEVNDAGAERQDAGQEVSDAGAERQDAGQEVSDAGAERQDAGSIDVEIPVTLEFTSFPVGSITGDTEFRYSVRLSKPGLPELTLVSGPQGAVLDETGLLVWQPETQMDLNESFVLRAVLDGETVEQSFSLDVAAIITEVEKPIAVDAVGTQVVSVTAPLSEIQGTTVAIPEGSFAGGTIAIGAIENPPSNSARLASSGAEPITVDFSPSGTHFEEPVTLTIPISDAVIAKIQEDSTRKVGVWTYDTEKMAWESLDVIAVDVDNKTAVVKTTHFSAVQAIDEESWIGAPNATVSACNTENIQSDFNTQGKNILDLPLSAVLNDVAVTGTVRDYLAGTQMDPRLEAGLRVVFSIDDRSGTKKSWTVSFVKNGQGFSATLDVQHGADAVSGYFPQLPVEDALTEGLMRGGMVSASLAPAGADGYGYSIEVSPLGDAIAGFFAETSVTPDVKVVPAGVDQNCDFVADVYAGAPSPILQASGAQQVEIVQGATHAVSVLFSGATSLSWTATSGVVVTDEVAGAGEASAVFSGLSAGNWQVLLRAENQYGNTAVLVYEVTVAAPSIPNDPPSCQVIRESAAVLYPGEAVLLRAIGQDDRKSPDELDYVINVTEPSAGASVAHAGELFTVSLDNASIGTWTVTCSASDGPNESIASGPISFSVVPRPINEVPVVQSVIPAVLDLEIANGGYAAAIVTVNASDDKVGALTFNASVIDDTGTSANLTWIAGGAHWASYEVRSSSEGSASIVFSAKDSQGAESQISAPVALIVHAPIQAAEVDLDNDGYPTSMDCDDNDANRFPGNTEICDDGIDQNCSGADFTSCDSDADGISDVEEAANGTDPYLADTDGDGLSDAQEPFFGTNPLLADTDSDGLLDGVEQFQTLTDPLDADTDGDGLNDGDEIVQRSSPSLPDTDADGLGDAEEAAAGTDPTHPDSDQDGLNDGVEISIFGTEPLNPDSDNDGFGDGEEVGCGTSPTDATVFCLPPVGLDTDGDGLADAEEASYGTSSELADTDGDGLLDGAEIEQGTDPLLPDSDFDGFSDGEEISCGADPLDENFICYQGEDADGDGIFDADEIAIGTDPNNNDTDGDGLSDGDEVFLTGTQPAIADTDGDGELDGQDPCPLDNPNDPDNDGECGFSDSDGDGIPDGAETLFGTDPNNSDTDADGFSDGDELSCGSDPLDGTFTCTGQGPCGFDEFFCDDTQACVFYGEPCGAMPPAADPCDTNGDGLVDAAEFEACRPLCDLDGNGLVTPAEDAQCQQDLCDNDGDGVLSPEELDVCAQNYCDTNGDGLLEDWEMQQCDGDPCQFDDDADGVGNCYDACPNNPDPLCNDPCAVDSDADGNVDCQDACPMDPLDECQQGADCSAFANDQPMCESYPECGYDVATGDCFFAGPPPVADCPLYANDQTMCESYPECGYDVASGDCFYAAPPPVADCPLYANDQTMCESYPECGYDVASGDCFFAGPPPVADCPLYANDQTMCESYPECSYDIATGDCFFAGPPPGADCSAFANDQPMCESYPECGYDVATGDCFFAGPPPVVDCSLYVNDQPMCESYPECGYDVATGDCFYQAAGFCEQYSQDQIACEANAECSFGSATNCFPSSGVDCKIYVGDPAGCDSAPECSYDAALDDCSPIIAGPDCSLYSQDQASCEAYTECTFELQTYCFDNIAPPPGADCSLYVNDQPMCESYPECGYDVATGDCFYAAPPPTVDCSLYVNDQPMCESYPECGYDVATGDCFYAAPPPTVDCSLYVSDQPMCESYPECGYNVATGDCFYAAPPPTVDCSLYVNNQPMCESYPECGYDVATGDCFFTGPPPVIDCSLYVNDQPMCESYPECGYDVATGDCWVL